MLGSEKDEKVLLSHIGLTQCNAGQCEYCTVPCNASARQPVGLINVFRQPQANRNGLRSNIM
jgi:hypothetical protein